MRSGSWPAAQVSDVWKSSVAAMAATVPAAIFLERVNSIFFTLLLVIPQTGNKRGNNPTNLFRARIRRRNELGKERHHRDARRVGRGRQRRAGSLDLPSVSGIPTDRATVPGAAHWRQFGIGRVGQ